MLYTIAEAVTATGLEESLILKAIEDGQITGTKNVSGEWHVEDAELHSLYLSIAQDYCKRQWQADLRRSDGRSEQPEIANIADNDEGRFGQEQTDTRTGAEQAEASPSTPATASTWQVEIRIDDRDKISASDSRPAFQPTRIRFVTATVLLALGCIGALSSFYFFGRSQVPEQKANSSGPVLGSEKASIPVTTLEPRSGGKLSAMSHQRQQMQLIIHTSWRKTFLKHLAHPRRSRSRIPPHRIPRRKKARRSPCVSSCRSPRPGPLPLRAGRCGMLLMALPPWKGPGVHGKRRVATPCQDWERSILSCCGATVGSWRLAKG